MSYLVKGFVYPIAEMDAEERAWHIRRMEKQIKAETAAMKKR